MGFGGRLQEGGGAECRQPGGGRGAQGEWGAPHRSRNPGRVPAALRVPFQRLVHPPQCKTPKHHTFHQVVTVRGVSLRLPPDPTPGPLFLSLPICKRGASSGGNWLREQPRGERRGALQPPQPARVQLKPLQETACAAGAGRVTARESRADKARGPGRPGVPATGCGCGRAGGRGSWGPCGPICTFQGGGEPYSSTTRPHLTRRG